MMRSVDRPVKLNGIDSRQHVTARACARSGTSERSVYSRAPGSGVGASSSVSPSNPLCSPNTSNSTAARESPCRLLGWSPWRLTKPDDMAAISYQYDAALQSASTGRSAGV